MDTVNLKTFLALSEIGSFTRTAEKLFIAQSTVSNRIVELEREIGKPLFTRDKKSIRLTREGKLFIDYARRMVELEQNSLKYVNQASCFDSCIRIGSTNTIYEAYLEKEILEMRKQNPAQSVQVVLGHSDELIFKIQDKILDVIYTYEPLYKTGFDCQVFHREKLVLVTSYENDRYKDGIQREQLSNINYYMCNFKLQGIGEFLIELFPPYKQFSFEIDNSTKMIPYLIYESGYSFLPQNLVETYIETKRLRAIPVKDLETAEIISYCIRKQKELPL